MGVDSGFQGERDFAAERQEILARMTAINDEIITYEQARASVVTAGSALATAVSEMSTSLTNLKRNEIIVEIDQFEGELAECLQCKIDSGIEDISRGERRGEQLLVRKQTQLDRIDVKLAQLRSNLSVWQQALALIPIG